MARGGARPNSGPVPKNPRKRLLVPPNLRKKMESAGEPITPLGYLLALVRDEESSEEMRFRAAVAAAPYVHPRIEKATQSKKDETAQGAKDAAVGRFATPAAPKLVVSNK